MIIIESLYLNYSRYLAYSILLAFLCLQTTSLVAQSYYLKYESPKSKLPRDIQKILVSEAYDSPTQAQEALEELLNQLRAEGYWEAIVTSQRESNDTLYVDLDLGQLVTWQKLETSQIPNTLLAKANLRPENWQKQAVRQSDIEKLQQSILSVAENNGYPFAQTWLDSIKWEKQGLAARLRYQSGPLMRFDSLIVEGNVRIKPDFFRSYLGLDSGTVFSQDKIKEADLRLRQLPYLRLQGEPSVLFDSKRAFVRLPIKKRRANRLDGIIGFLPNEAQDDNLLLTGEVNLLLHNLFSSGKTLMASWQRLQAASQQIHLGYEHPNFLFKNVDLSFEFTLLRQDSTFVNAERAFGLSYRLGKGRSLDAELRYQTSRLGEATRFADLDSLPPFSSVNYLSYGLSYKVNRLDDIFFPKKGIKLKAEGNFGRKNIQFSPLLADSLFDDVPLSTNQANLILEGELFFPITTRAVFKSSFRGNYLINEYLFLNDLFRLGGLNRLRGHNENEFYVSASALLTLEYQLFVGDESLLFIFYDQAYLVRDLPDNFSEDFPLGFGAGMRFSTRSGIFSFVYALGQSENQTIAFNRSKIHFGLVSKF